MRKIKKKRTFLKLMKDQTKKKIRRKKKERRVDLKSVSRSTEITYLKSS